ncbi:MAG: twin-arginine translocase TatA/TatE family subunit [Candidatus Schmidhempelia sp.]|nr:twin-arginine translocase TatA/TatE family subunit [Candidatus Schmidhempelia sp.]
MMPSLPQLLILIAVVVLLFGTKKLRTLGEDLGAAIKGFKKAMSDDEESKNTTNDKTIAQNEKNDNDK